ncbi:MAG: Ldh family oxidoreductase, partial [Anaerolineae bacterium]|nr:Ldh family oxidoreductase [Anaerolineae bacterium]
ERVDAFRPVEAFKDAMDDLQNRLKNAPKAEGQDRIYIHGEKEYEQAEENARRGVPLNPKVVTDLKALGKELDVAYDLG